MIIIINQCHYAVIGLFKIIWLNRLLNSLEIKIRLFRHVRCILTSFNLIILGIKFLIIIRYSVRGIPLCSRPITQVLSNHNLPNYPHLHYSQPVPIYSNMYLATSHLSYHRYQTYSSTSQYG